MTSLSRRSLLHRTAIGALSVSTFGTHGSALAQMIEDDNFKREVIDILKRHHPEWAIDAGGDARMIAIDAQRLSLDNLYSLTRDHPAQERETIILDFVESAQAGTDKPAAESISFTQARDRLLLQIVPSGHKHQVPSLLTRPFLADLHVSYVLDDEKSYELVKKDVLAAWKIEREEIERIALMNFEKLTAEQELVSKTADNGGFFLTVDNGDSFSAVRLILPSFMARVRETLKAPSVFVGIPNRDFIVAWTPDFAPRRRFATAIYEDSRHQAYPLTDTLFVSSADGVRLASTEELRDHGR